MLKDKKIIICITSSIAAIELPKLIRELKRRGAEIHCFMSRAAQNIIHPNAIHWASKNKVITELTGESEHILHTYDEKADLILIAPATSNIIAKVAHGISDSCITTLISCALGAKIPIIAIPTMHLNMYHNLTKLNIEKLTKLGIDIISPKIEENKAKFPDRDKVVEIIGMKLTPKDLKGKKILVTAGSTIEEIDPIRFIANRSSGKMGIAIAHAAHKRGAAVTLIRGHTKVDPILNYKDIKISSAKEMHQAIKDNINVDIVIHTAAVSDFTIEKNNRKINSSKKLNLELTPTTKILEKIKKLNKKVYLVGFKAEYNVTNQQLVDKAYQKLLKANCDLVVANDVARKDIGFEHNTNECIVVDKDAKSYLLRLNNKEIIANEILDLIP